MLLLVALLAAVPAVGQEYLYTPSPAEAGAAASGEAVLVREITVKKGDTLYRISRNNSGRGSYYPQILLFNELKNPNLIYPGNVLRVPVSSSAVVRKNVEMPEQQQIKVKTEVKPPAAAPSRKAIERPKVSSAQQPPSNERTRYQKAMESYNAGDCSTAIKLLDGFIASHPNSSLIPEATLNRAECYLKLSSKKN